MSRDFKGVLAGRDFQRSLNRDRIGRLNAQLIGGVELIWTINLAWRGGVSLNDQARPALSGIINLTGRWSSSQPDQQYDDEFFYRRLKLKIRRRVGPPEAESDVVFSDRFSLPTVNRIARPIWSDNSQVVALPEEYLEPVSVSSIVAEAYGVLDSLPFPVLDAQTHTSGWDIYQLTASGPQLLQEARSAHLLPETDSNLTAWTSGQLGFGDANDFVRPFFWPADGQISFDTDGRWKLWTPKVTLIMRRCPFRGTGHRWVTRSFIPQAGHLVRTRAVPRLELECERNFSGTELRVSPNRVIMTYESKQLWQNEYVFPPHRYIRSNWLDSPAPSCAPEVVEN